MSVHNVSTVSVVLAYDNTPLLRFLEELREALRLASPDVAHFAQEILKGLLSRPNALHVLLDVNHRSTTGADMVFAIGPSDFGRNVLAAIRAVKIERHAI